MKNTLITTALLIALLPLFPLAAQDAKSPSIPEIVERVALALADDGIFTDSETAPVCEGSRDAGVCREFEDYLDELLAIEKGMVDPAAERLPFDRQPRVRMKRIAERMEERLPKIENEKSRETVKAEAQRLKGIA